MKTIHIKPLYWIEIRWLFQLKEIKFWMKKNDIINILGIPRSIELNKDEETLYYYDNSLQLIIDKKIWILVYIYIIHYLSKNVFIDNISVFNTKAEELINKFNNLYQNNKKLSVEWYWYIYNELEISFSRQWIPWDIVEDIWETDYEKWIYFFAVWLWMKWYYSNYYISD